MPDDALGVCRPGPPQGLQTRWRREALVLRVNGAPKAIISTCLHLGGPLHQEGNKLVCAWRGAEFARNDGCRLKGPARADARLMVLPTRIEDGVLTYVYGE